MTNLFSSLLLSQKLLTLIGEMGFTEMTPIQSASIPILLAGKDLVGQSQTGSGKTAAFIIPILEKIDVAKAQPQALILCPTRELSDQVLRECQKFSKAYPGVVTLPLVGGKPMAQQITALHRGAHILVGTPGRTLDHFKNRNIYVESLKTLVLDEADRMLEEGFAEEMDAILEHLPKERQTIFFSATYPEGIAALSEKHQKNAERVTITADPGTKLQIEQHLYEAENPDKVDALLQILQSNPSECTLVFCRTKNTVREIGNRLTQLKVNNDILHGDLEQKERDRATALFRNGSTRILVATDVAARGLDIDSLELVINLDLPPSTDIYIHRIGRTGRAGRKGKAISVATAYEVPKIAEIEEATGVNMIRQILSRKGAADFGPEFRKAPMRTLQIAGGKKNKLRPGDILGALTGPPEPLLGKDIGKINIYDYFSYVAINSDLAEQALNKLRNTTVKAVKFKVYLI